MVENVDSYMQQWLKCG